MKYFRLVLRSVLAYFLGNIAAFLFVSNEFFFLLLLVLIVLYLIFIDHKLNFAIFFFCLFMFFISFFAFINSFDSQINANEEGEVVCVDDEVDVRKDHVKYIMKSERFGRFLVRFDLYPRFEYGDCVLFEGKIQPANSDEDFDYKKYLERFDVYGISYNPKLSFYSQNRSTFYFIYKMKNKFDEQLKRLYLEPDASLVAGLLLGSRGGLGQELMEDFNRVGLTHIVAVSGSNVAILIVFVSFLFGFLSKKLRLAFSLLMIILFVIFAGMSASVVRAGIMGGISILVLWGGKSYFTGFALFYSAFFMTLFDPKVLIYDLGFQLSFLASIGVIYFVPKIEKYFLALPKLLAIRESFVLSLASQIVTLPIIMYAFGRISIVSVFVNLIILPFVPLIMLLGFISFLMSVYFETIGLFFASLNHLLISFVLILIKTFANLKFASLEINKISFLTMSFLIRYFYCLIKN